MPKTKRPIIPIRILQATNYILIYIAIGKATHPPTFSTIPPTRIKTYRFSSSAPSNLLYASFIVLATE